MSVSHFLWADGPIKKFNLFSKTVYSFILGVSLGLVKSYFTFYKKVVKIRPSRIRFQRLPRDLCIKLFSNFEA